MPEKTDYNGWTNWETWQVPLWLDNEQATYHERRRLTALYGNNTITAPVAKAITQFIFGPDGTPDMKPGDMANVNWEEVARYWEDERLEDAPLRDTTT